MLELHIHPDNVIIIRENRAIIYIESIDNFYIDYCSSPELLPNVRWNERLYVQGQMDRLCDSFTEETTLNAWAVGDAILASKEDLIAAKEARLA